MSGEMCFPPPAIDPGGGGSGDAGAIFFGDANGLPTTNRAALNWDTTHSTLQVNNATLNAPGSGNIFLGSGTGNFTLSGSSNIGIGNGVFAALTSGVNNVGVGQTAFTNLTTGSYSVAIGWDAGAFVTTGTQNVAIGSQAMGAHAGVNANYCVAIGYRALEAVTADYNTMIGFQAGSSITSGTHNTAIGGGTFSANTTGSDNTVIGFNAMNVGTGDQNTAIGVSVLTAVTTASYNTGVGYNALSALTSGLRNVAIGYQALNATQTGNDACAMGWGALVAATGDFNVGIGKQALYGTTSGTLNVGIGASAGATITTGGKNTFLGTISDANANNYSNAVAIGYNAIVGASSTMVLGGTGADAVSVVINGTTAARRFEIRDTSIQQRLTYTAGSVYTDLSTDSSGNFNFTPTGVIALFDKSSAGNNIQIRSSNSDNTNGASHASFYALAGGASGGDAYYLYGLAGVLNWAHGIDNSDSDSWVLSASSGLGSSNVIKCTTTLSVIAGKSAIGTTATDGFLYFPAAAGAPTGAPTAQTGFVAMYYDTTNNNFYVYNGAWKKVLLT